MNRKIFDKTNPFTAPEGYFDTFQDRIMESLKFEVSGLKFNSGEGFAVEGSDLLALCEAKVKPQFSIFNFQFSIVRTLVAAAACILFIFAGATLYTVFSDRQPLIAELSVDDDFYRWVYVSDEATLLAESLDIEMSERLISQNDHFEENDSIISFLERDNISVAAIAMFLRNNQ